MPAVGLLLDNVEDDPDMLDVVPPVDVPHGKPLAPMRPEVGEFNGLGFEALGFGLPGVMAEPPGAVPLVAPEAVPAEPPPLPAPPLCANASPVLLRRTTVASKANRCLVCGMNTLL